MSAEPETDIILVNEADIEIGFISKMQAHVEGLLHRAFSVIVFDPVGNILLQQRAAHKYHSQKLWTNACCSHPQPDEDVLQAAHRRLMEEMNFDCALMPMTILHYQTPPLDTGLIENEMLHLFAGVTEQKDFTPDTDEVMAWRWISPDALIAEVKEKPEEFSFWFRLYLEKFDMKEIFGKLSS